MPVKVIHVFNVNFISIRIENEKYNTPMMYDWKNTNDARQGKFCTANRTLLISSYFPTNTKQRRKTEEKSFFLSVKCI